MKKIRLSVALGPHIHYGIETEKIISSCFFALLPAAIFGCYQYGMLAVRVLALSMGSAILFEYIARKLMGKESSLSDWSALFQGLLLGIILPPNTSWWIVIIGTFLMIIVAKQFFGGIGYYPLNPTLLAFAIMYVSWPKRMASLFPLSSYHINTLPVDPLIALKTYGPSVVDAYKLKDLFMGLQTGGIASGAILFILIGGIYLIIRGFISATVSISYIAGVIITAYIFHVANPTNYVPPLFHLLSGMTMLAAFFLITDTTTCPVNRWARVIYGLLAGMLTILIRNIGAYPDGTVFAILIVNLFHPLIDRIHKGVLQYEGMNHDTA